MTPHIGESDLANTEAQRAPFSVQEVLQVVVTPWSHCLQTATHWSKDLGL